MGLSRFLVFTAAVGMALAALPAEAKRDRQRGDPDISFKAPVASDPVSLGQTYDCYQKKRKWGGLIGALGSSDEGKHKTMAVAAAREALDRGYNYVVLGPLQQVEDRYQSTTTNWEIVGTGFGADGLGMFGGIVTAPVTRTRKISKPRHFLACRGVDDIDAFRIMWDEQPAYRPKPFETLVDIRSLLTALGPEVEGSDYTPPPPREPLISASHFRQPGDRERLIRQLDVMRAAATCRREHSTFDSARAATLPQSADQSAAMDACLESLRDEASASGWERFPLFVDDGRTRVAERGYTLTRPAPREATPGALKVDARAVDPALWGEGWVKPPTDLAAFDGRVLIRDDGAGRKRELMVVGTNTGTVEDLYDVAMFLTAQESMGDPNPGIGLSDATPTYRRQFDRDTSNLRERAAYSASLDATQQRQLEEQRRELERSFKMMESYRSQMGSEEWANFVANHDLMLADLDRQQAEMSGENPVTVAASASEEGDRKGIYRMFETYANVLIVNGRSITRCSEQYYEACADKLQAYNAVGPRVVGAGFVPLSRPPSYQAFVAGR